MGMNRHNILAGIILGLTGFAINWFKLELFFNVDFLFGSIVVMFAMMRYGLTAGTIAALVAATSAWHHWHQPWAILILTAEAFFAGLLAKKYRWELLSGVICFWSSIGILLVCFFYYRLMGFSAQATLLTALKHGVNGIFNALVAMWLSTVVSSRNSHRLELPSLYQIIFVSLALFVLIPAMGYLYFDIRKTLDLQLGNYRESTSRTCEISEHSVSLWLTLNRDTVMTLAGLAGSAKRTTQPEMQRMVETVRSQNSEFRRVGIFNKDAITRAFSPRLDDKGVSSIGLNMSDRDFNAILKSPPHPFVFDVDMVRIGTPSPRLILLAPMLDGESYQGAAFGIVDFSVLQHLLDEIVGARPMTVSLVDQKGRVVISTRKSLKTLDTFSLPANGLVTSIVDGVGHWIPDKQAGVDDARRWFGSFYVREMPLAIGNGWKVVVESSVRPRLEAISRQTSLSLGIVAFLILTYIALSRLFASRYSSVLQKLSAATQELPTRISSGEVVVWPQPITREMASLIVNIQLMTETVQKHVSELKSLNETLEQRVTERTRELQEALHKLQIRQLELETQYEQMYRIQLELDSSRERYFELYDQAPVGYLTLDEEGLVREANLTVSNLLGVERGTLVNQAFTSYILPEDQDVCRLHRKQLLSSGAPQTCELRMLKVDDSQFWAKVEAVAAQDKGSGETVFRVVVSDITERKQAEQSLQKSEKRFKNMFRKHSAVMLLIAPESGAIVDANLAAERFYGHSYEKIVAMNIAEINAINPELVNLERQLALEERRSYFIFPHKIASGEIRAVEVHSTPININNTTLLFSIIHDITERKQMEIELRQALETAKSTNATMNRLLRTVAHEFRTPLGLLTGSTDILDRYWDRLTPEKRLEQNEHIRNAAHQLTSLVNSVISYDQLETDKSGPPALPQALGPFCRVIATEVETVWGAGQKYNVTIAADCGSALLDTSLFRRVLENLLTNAFRYTPTDGSVSLHVCRRNDRLLLEVADNGIGIPEGDLELVFEAFYRSRNIEGRRGLGLGLSIVQESLSQMGGSITVASRIDEGTLMRVEIPVQR